MKRFIRSSDYIQAMATINPQLCNQLQISVEVEQRNEGDIPHVHVYHDKSRNPRKCSYIRLDKPEYSDHHKNAKPLPPALKKEFIEVMTSPWQKELIETPTGVRPATGYEAAVGIWVDTYEEGNLDKFETDSNGQLIPVDYSNLTVKT